MGSNASCTRAKPDQVSDPDALFAAAAKQNVGPEAASPIVSFEQALIFPPWCFKDAIIDDNVRQTVKASWNVLLSGETRPFKEAKAMRPKLKPLVFFYNVFYDSFFSLVPEVLPLYTGGMNKQGKMLAHIIHFIVTNLDGGEEFENTLRYLAVLHNQRSVDPAHYSPMGLCLLFAVRRCIGEELFTAEAKYCWSVLYSRMMQIFIPIAVTHQMEQDPQVLAKMHHYQIEASIASSAASASVMASNMSASNGGSVASDGGSNHSANFGNETNKAEAAKSAAANLPPAKNGLASLASQGSKLSIGSATSPYVVNFHPDAAALEDQVAEFEMEKNGAGDKHAVFNGGNSKAVAEEPQDLQA